MVIAGKVFRLEQLSLPEIGVKLKDHRSEEDYVEGDQEIRLLTEVVGLVSKGRTLRGIYSHDYVFHIFHHGKVAPFPRTVEAVFCFVQSDNATFLTIVEKKRLANFVANKLSEILFERVGGVLEARISPETLKEFHLRNPEDTKIAFFDNVDIPNLNKLSLYGPDLVNTSIFENYAKHGDLWYVVAKSREYGYVVGLTREASVTVFNLSDKEKYMDYVAKELFPLVAT